MSCIQRCKVLQKNKAGLKRALSVDFVAFTSGRESLRVLRVWEFAALGIGVSGVGVYGRLEVKPYGLRIVGT